MSLRKYSAEVYRFPRMKNHLEEFIAHDLPWILEDLESFDVISGHCYVCKLTNDFKRGIDFYIFLGEKEIPVQVTDNKDSISVFSEQGIVVIFLPEKDKTGELLFPEEKRKIFIKKLEKAIRKMAYH